MNIIIWLWDIGMGEVRLNTVKYTQLLWNGRSTQMIENMERFLIIFKRSHVMVC